MTRILCTGDLHIGSGTDYSDDRLADQEAVLDQIVELARDAELVLIPGDVFHRPRPNPSELHLFARFVRRLERLGVPAVACLGNAGHDQDGFGRPAALELFESDLFRVSRHPERIIIEGVQVCTLPSVPVSRLVAEAGGGERGEIFQDAADLLLRTARDLRDGCAPELPAILLGHWSIAGAALPSGLPVADLNETVLDLGALEDLDFDAVVFGHIHRAQPLGTLAPDDEKMPIFYTGSPCVVNFGEADVAHGCWQIDLGDGYPRTTFVPLADRPFITVHVDFTDGEDFSQLLEHYGDWSHLEDAVVRVRYRAGEDDHRRVDQAAVKRALLDLGAHRVFQIVPDIVRAQRARAEGVDETLGPLDALASWSVANEIDTAPADALHRITSSYLERLAA